MGTEVERKFLVRGSEWRPGARGVAIRQAYLVAAPGCTVRIRLHGSEAFLTLKGPTHGEHFGPTPPLPNACLSVKGGYRVTKKVPDGVPVWGYLRLTITPTQVRFEMVPVAVSQPPDRGRIDVHGRTATVTAH